MTKLNDMKIGDAIVLGILLELIELTIVVSIIRGNLFDGIGNIGIACFGCGISLFFWYVGMIKNGEEKNDTIN